MWRALLPQNFSASGGCARKELPHCFCSSVPFLPSKQVVCRHCSQILPRVPNFALVPLSTSVFLSLSLGEKRERIGYGPTFFYENITASLSASTLDATIMREGLITSVKLVSARTGTITIQRVDSFNVGFNSPVRFAAKESRAREDGASRHRCFARRGQTC